MAGTLRGSRLVVAESPGLRPTPDRVRETVFNWLAPVVAGASCLDLYAGTGAMGIEALSRGAGSCVFVERDRHLAAALRANLARLKVVAGQVVEDDALRYLDDDAQASDIVFLDPPFDAGLWGATVHKLELGGWLRADAWVHVEMPADLQPQVPPTWSLYRHGHAGGMAHALYRRTARDPLS